MKPIIFSTPMVKAILSGSKTQTRRIVNHKPSVNSRYNKYDTLYVREAWNDDFCDNVIYRASVGSAKDAGYDKEPKWKPSIHMPKKYARIFLKITNVRIEKLRNISTQDILNEGVEIEYNKPATIKEILSAWINLWDGINGKRGYGWVTNPLVYVIEFKVISKEEAMQ